MITSDNNFAMVNFQKKQLRTGLVRVFSIPTANSVFLHCRVKVCVNGDEDNCALVSFLGLNSLEHPTSLVFLHC